MNIIYILLKGVLISMEVMRTIDYEQEFKDNQKVVRDRVLESMKGIKAGEGRDYNEFFDELEKKYKNA